MGYTKYLKMRMWKTLAVLVTLLLEFSQRDVTAELSVSPQNTEVMINQSAYFNCTTTLIAGEVLWLHGSDYIYGGGVIIETYAGRFIVEGNAAAGEVNLVILSARHDDMGSYSCQDKGGIGNKSSAELIVLEANPICQSDVNLKEIIGPNSCNLSPDILQLSCVVAYSGNVAPSVEWIMGESSPVTGKFTDSVSGGRYSYNVTMEAEFHMDNASYTCRTKRAKPHRYSCKTEPVMLLYAFNSTKTIDTSIGEQITCLANSSQSCTYRWYWFQGSNKSLESEDHTLNPARPGSYRCEAHCPIKGSPCTVQPLVVFVVQASSSSDKGVLPWIFIIPVVVVVIVSVVLMVFLCRRHQSKKPKTSVPVQEMKEQEPLKHKASDQDYVLKPSFVKVLKTKTGQSRIVAVTVLDNGIFILVSPDVAVEVYDATSYEYTREFKIIEVARPIDMTSCSRNRCLYIVNESELVRVDPTGILVKKWKIDEKPVSLSVSQNSDVVVVYRNVIFVYTSDGIFKQEIRPVFANVNDELLHAVETANGDFLISFGMQRSYTNTETKKISHALSFSLYTVNTDGMLKMRLTGIPKERSFNKPSRTVIDSNGTILVADQYNKRVLLVNSGLEYVRDLLDASIYNVKSLGTICLDEADDQSRLFVVDNISGDPEVLVFKVL